MTIQGSKLDSAQSAVRQVAFVRPSESEAIQSKPVAQSVPPKQPVAVEDSRELHARVAARLQEYLRSNGRNLEIRVDDAANATVITVRRADTGEVVRQFPTEEALSMLRRLNEQSGTLVDELA
jgi:flagellar protein FlaG